MEGITLIKGNYTTQRKICPSVTLSTTNPMQTGLESDCGLQGVNSHSICILKSGTQPNCSMGMVQKVQQHSDH